MLDSEGRTLLSAEKVNTFISKEHLIKDFGLSIKEGERIGIVGATGSGKSLAMKSLLSLIDERSCQIEYDKLDFFDGKVIEELRAIGIAMVFQNPRMSLNPVRKCGKQVTRVVRKHLRLSKDDARQKVLDLFNKVQITNAERIFDSYPHEVSGGELQRVMIAMGLSCSPKLLVLDEPAASLDKVRQYEIVRLLQELSKTEKLALLVISHDLEMIADLVDQVIHISEGKVIERQNTEDYFIRPKSDKSKALIKQLKSFRGRPYLQALMTKTVLDAKGLSYRFPSGNYAFKNISIDLKKGETYGIVGESGSGKSSLGKCLGKIWQASLGEIKWEEDVCYIFQDAFSAMDPHLKVKSILNEVLRLKDSVEIEAGDLLKEVLLSPSILEKRISEISGGQRQRVNLARAIASNAKIIICDEITSGLDLNVQFEIVDLLLNKLSNHTKVFITHDISLAKIVSHRILVMQNGMAVNQGLTKEIFEQSSSGYTYQLINSIPKVKYFLNM